MMKTLLLSLLAVVSHGFSSRLKRTPCIAIRSSIDEKLSLLRYTPRSRHGPSQLSLVPDTTLLQDIFSNENIKKAFSLGTFGPQLLWLLMIVIPKSDVTKKIMGGYSGVLFFSLLHLFVVVASASQQDGTAPIVEFQGVFDASPEANPQAAMLGMMRYPNFVTEEWTHVLTWDLFVGRWIWLDGLKRNIFTAHSVLLCNLIGPPGLLLHFLTCAVSSKGFPASDAIDETP